MALSQMTRRKRLCFGFGLNPVVMAIFTRDVVRSAIGEISSSTIEQTSGIGQVSAAMTRLEHPAQQNAALV